MELDIIHLFRIHQVSLTFSVIPFVCAGDVHDPTPQTLVPLTREKADILRHAHQDGTVDIALHGYSHQTTTRSEMMEFAGVAYPIQSAKISQAREFLQLMTGAQVTAFVPPWNRYDADTLRAMLDADLSLISADSRDDAHGDALLRYLPATCELANVRDAVEHARGSNIANPVIVVLFHDYDFAEVNSTLGTSSYGIFQETVAWLRMQEDVRLLSLSEAARVIRDLSVERFLKWRGSWQPVY